MLSGPPASLAASISAWHVSSSDVAPADDRLETFRRHDAGQAVRAEQQPIAGLHVDLGDVDLRIVAARERARDDVAPRMAPRVGLASARRRAPAR